MQCPNPACKRELFRARVLRKEVIKGLPMLPIELTCDHCKRKIKAWVINQNLKDIHANLKILMEGQQMLYEMLQSALKPKERKGFFDAIRERFSRERRE